MFKTVLYSCNSVQREPSGAYSMTRTELMYAASKKLDEAAMLLLAAGEDRLAVDAQELAEWVDFSSPPLHGKGTPTVVSH